MMVPSLTAGSEYPSGGGGGDSFFVARRRFIAWLLRRRIPRVAFWCPVVSWSGKFPIERCYLWGWKSVSAVGVACPDFAVLLWGLIATHSWSVPSLTRRMGFSWTCRVRLSCGSPFWRTTGLSSSVCAPGFQRQCPGECQMGIFAGWLLPVTCLGLPSSSKCG